MVETRRWNDKELDIESEAWVISEELLKACQTKLRYHLVAAGLVNNQSGGSAGGASSHADSALAKTSSILDAALKENASLKQDFTNHGWASARGGYKGKKGVKGGYKGGYNDNGKKGVKGGYKGGYNDGQGSNQGGFSGYQKRKFHDGWRNDFERDNRVKLPERR